MLLRAIREGISHDGRVLHSQMWYASFRALSDDDAESIVAYLRSLKPIRRVLPPTGGIDWSPLVAMLVLGAIVQVVTKL